MFIFVVEIKTMKPKKIESIENKAWNLVNRKWKKWNPESIVLDRFRIEWYQACEELNYKPNYTFTDIIA